MKIYEKIKEASRMGYMTLIKDNRGLYSIYSTLTEDGVRWSGWHTDKQGALNTIGFSGSSGLFGSGTEIIEFIPFASLGGFKVGDKVRDKEKGRVATIVNLFSDGSIEADAPYTILRRTVMEVEPYFDEETDTLKRITELEAEIAEIKKSLNNN